MIILFFSKEFLDNSLLLFLFFLLKLLLDCFYRLCNGRRVQLCHLIKISLAAFLFRRFHTHWGAIIFTFIPWVKKKEFNRNCYQPDAAKKDECNCLSLVLISGRAA